MSMELSQRLRSLPPYLFKEIDRKKEEVMAKGIDIIDLGVGDPDIPTPGHIIEALKSAVDNPTNHRYPSYTGMKEFREAVSLWYKERFGVELNPEQEVVSLIGSKEGIAHLPLAFIDPGDIALVPSPAYPVYNIGTIFAGGISHFMPLLEENDFLPDLKAIPKDVLPKAKIMFINYPNNPTSAVATKDFFQDVVSFAKENHLLVCHDAAYTEMAFDGYNPSSFLEVDGAKDVGIEFHSLSKTFNMTGWRIGFAVGNREAIQALGAVKSNIDSGVFQAIQIAGIKALLGDKECIQEMRGVYEKRRDIMVNGLQEAGFKLRKPKATFYLWVRVPDEYTSTEITKLFLDKGVVVTPGNGFGKPGEGYVRMALTQEEERLKEAISRIKSISL